MQPRAGEVKELNHDLNRDLCLVFERDVIATTKIRALRNQRAAHGRACGSEEKESARIGHGRKSEASESNVDSVVQSRRQHATGRCRDLACVEP